MTTDSQEQAILRGLARNDGAAVETIYRTQYRAIQNMVLNNSGSADDARDVFQEALIVLYEKARSGSFELHCQIKTYLYAVSRRLWLKKLQQRPGGTIEMDGVEETIATEDDIAASDERNQEFAAMEEAMQQLGEPCKSLLESYYVHKKSMLEIARDFGYTNADNAKNQKYKCLMRLKKMFFEKTANR